jgi:hypothetical protein
MEEFHASEIWPPQLIGLLLSLSGMLLGSLLPNLLGKHIVAHPRPPV